MWYNKKKTLKGEIKMIIDNLKNCGLYYGAHKRFEAAFDFIKKAEEENLEIGKYEIDGKNLYAIVQEYTAKLPEDAKFETHKNYIDIQYIISGKEKMEMMDIEKATPKTDYNPEKDVTFYENTDCTTVGFFADGEYGIYFPNDVHRPGMAIDVENRETVRKIVVKVKVD